MGPGSADDAFADYLFERRNPRGVHFERWRHAFGCGKWFHVARDTATLEIFGSYSGASLGAAGGNPRRDPGAAPGLGGLAVSRRLAARRPC